MRRSPRDLVDTVAPPPPRERWRWLVYATLMVIIASLAVLRQSSGSTQMWPGSQQAHVELDGDAVVVSYAWGNYQRSDITLSSVRSMHDALTILSVDGLPQRIAADGFAAITIRMRIDCDRLLLDSHPVLRLETDEPFWRTSRQDVDLSALTARGGLVCK